MTFEQFKKMVYHTEKSIRIPGSESVIDKTQLMVKGRFNQKKADVILLEVYERENYKSR